ncbi:MAG: arginine--tRNA ligase [Kiritimatiellaeota bacterium]|nr:arginine--tRNA ligase [Kiritimatiellota bacterium]
MDSIDHILTAWLRDVFRQTFPGVGDFADVAAVAATDAAFGDYQCNAAMALAKQMKKPPRAIAQAVVNHKPLHEAVAALDLAGPGFINIRLREDWLAGRLDVMARDERLSVAAPGAGRTVVLDYSSPNVAKPMHIGHIRSTVIGNALDRLYRFLGYRVIADNHLGDWGTQFGILIMGYRHFVDRQKLSATPIEELERIYVLSYEKSEASAEWKTQCRQELVKLQAGDNENLVLWKQFVDLSIAEFEHMYRRLGVKFDLTRGESFYHDRLPATIDRLEQQGLARESEGALVVFLEEEKLPVCIVRKSDGAFNYAATDIATVLSRVEEFQPELIVYVTDERQQLHFAQIFAICKRLGIPTRLEHVWFGLMRLPEGTFSTRQGNVIKLEKLLDEAESRALAVVRETSPEMPPEQQEEVARAVGIGAVKYADLSQNPQSLVTFSWDKALALNGNSAPYLQYAYARIRSVEDKYRDQFPGKDPASFPLILQENVERQLAVHLVRFAEIVSLAARMARPSALADYLYELAGLYNSFYQNVPFLKAPEGVRESRVRLCGLVAQVLGRGLNLLGIETPERI